MFLNIELERLRRAIPKAEMAQQLAVPPYILDDWIYRRRAIPADKLRALSRLFDGLSLDYLLRERR